jgi:hypothetical protein
MGVRESGDGGRHPAPAATPDVGGRACGRAVRLLMTYWPALTDRQLLTLRGILAEYDRVTDRRESGDGG